MADGLTPPALAGDAAADVDAPAPLVIDMAGKQFRVAEKIGGLALMRFAKSAQSGVDSNSLKGLAVMYDLLRSVVHRDDWQAFEDHAEEEQVSGDDLLEAVFSAMGAIAGRPTSRPSDSSGGPSTTSTNSSGDSSSVVTELLDRGRPELALLVSQAGASRLSA